MTITAVQIGNFALSHVGTDSTINDLAEASSEAIQVNLWYEQSRIQTLQAYDWGFARKREALVTHTDAAPEAYWAYRYIYPGDCVKFLSMQNPAGVYADKVPFQIELDLAQDSKSIVTDLNEAVGIYTFNLTEPSLFSLNFADALSLLIAHRICQPLTGDRALRNELLERYRQMVRFAGAEDAREEGARAPRNADWIRGRQ